MRGVSSVTLHCGIHPYKDGSGLDELPRCSRYIRLGEVSLDFHLYILDIADHTLDIRLHHRRPRVDLKLKRLPVESLV